MSKKLNKNVSYTVRARQLVHFEFEDTAARKVCVAGSFNGWHPQAFEMIAMGSGRPGTRNRESPASERRDNGAGMIVALLPAVAASGLFGDR